MNSEEDVYPAPQDDAGASQDFAAVEAEPLERPPVEAYDPHFGRQAMTKDSFWRL